MCFERQTSISFSILLTFYFVLGLNTRANMIIAEIMITGNMIAMLILTEAIPIEIK